MLIPGVTALQLTGAVHTLEPVFITYNATWQNRKGKHE